MKTNANDKKPAIDYKELERLKKLKELALKEKQKVKK